MSAMGMLRQRRYMAPSFRTPRHTLPTHIHFSEARFWPSSCWPAIHSRLAYFGLVAVSLRVQQTPIDFLSGTLRALSQRPIRAYFRDGLGLDSSLQPRAAIHSETAMRQGLLHSQIGHWPRRSVLLSVVTGPDLTRQSS